MKLSVKALTLATAIAWALAMLVVGILNIISPGYCGEYLKVIASLYPGYKASGTFIDVISRDAVRPGGRGDLRVRVCPALQRLCRQSS